MAKSKTARLRILSHIIVGYMLLAFVWWTILLLIKTNDLYQAKIQVFQIESTAGLATRQTDHDLMRELRGQRVMIIGEGLVFVLALLIGIWLINRGYAKEIETIRQKRNFLLAITHELKSPLASIKVILETFLRRILSPDDNRRLSQNALMETERLGGLIDNLLLAARLDKSYEPVFEWIDLLSIVKEVKKNILNLHPETAISIRSSDEYLMGNFDRQGMYSTIFNLCENAVKYSGETPKILINLSTIGNDISLQVKDHGIGITAIEKKKIFDQFYRAGNEETRWTTGTGLGLYIVERIINLHLGKISVSDNVPSGTIFSIRLPIGKKHANFIG